MPDESGMSSDETVRRPPPAPADPYAVRFGSFELTETAGFKPAQDDFAEAEGSRIGSYQLVEELGQGGFGTVWRAVQLEPIRREVALKVIKPGMDSREIIARFEVERQTLALMDHPNIAGVLDAGTTRLGRPYFVMEMVRGVPITVYCDAHKLTIRERVELFIPVCRAVQHAHQKSVLHRDLKPSNILVTEVDGSPVPKVIDFGIAKAIGGPAEGAAQSSLLQTQEGAVVGTPQYMSPEQAGSAADLDTRSDIYTLGVILYELLSGTPPLSRDTVRKSHLNEVLRLIREHEPMRPSIRLLADAGEAKQTSAARGAEPARLIRELRGDLDWITLKAIEKERERRYESAASLAQDLERHLDHQPVDAGPPSALYRLRKMVRRNRLAVASALVILVLLVAGIAVSTSQAVRATKAEDLALERLHLVTEERSRTAQALSRADHRQAAKLVAEEKLPEALAHLARAIRTDPRNVAAGSAVMALLAQRTWALPLERPRRIDAGTRHAALSANGRRIANCDGSNVLKVWDRETAAPVGAGLEHPVAVARCVFTPDGRFLASVSTTSKIPVDCALRVWDVENQRAVTDFIRPHDEIEALAISPDGLKVVTGSTAGAQVWDVPSGKPVGEPIPADSRLHYLTFSPDGSRVLLGSWDTARILDLGEGSFVGERMEHTLLIEYAAFSPDGRLVATASYDKTVRIWDAHTGAAITEPIPHENAVMRVAFSPDGRRLVSTCEDNGARLFDSRTGRLIASPMMHAQYVRDVAFSPDGRRIFTASGDYDHPLTVHVWDAHHGALLAESIQHDDAVLAAAVSPDGSTAVTASKDGTVLVWNTRDLTPVGDARHHDGPVNFATFNRDGSLIATASDDGTARLWDARSGAQSGESLQHEDAVKHVAFSPDGLRLVTASRDKSAKVWDARTGKEFGVPLHHDLGLNFASFSPDGERIVTASEDNTARIWDARSGAPLTEPLRHDASDESGGEGVQSAVFSPDGTLVLTASRDRTARLWHARTGEPAGPPLMHPTVVNSAVFSRDGKLVATASGQYGRPGLARVWKVDTGTPITGPLPHADGVVAVSFSEDDRRLVTASFDRTARVWDVNSGQPVGEPLMHDGFVTSAIFAGSRHRVLTTTWDGKAWLWNLPEDDDPVPGWLADVAEAIGGSRLNEADVFEPVPPERLFALREELTRGKPSDGCARFIQWFFAPRPSRAIAPGSFITIPAFVDRRIEEGTESALERAHLADPGNATVWKLLQEMKEASP